jgi:hypothetical protein
MSVTLLEVSEFLKDNKELLHEMLVYKSQKLPAEDEEIEDDAKLMSQYQRLKTYLLEKKMGLL